MQDLDVTGCGHSAYLVVQRIREIGRHKPSGRGREHGGRGLLSESLMRAELVERVHEGVESFLLLQKTVSRRPCGVLFESAVHPLVSAVLLRLAGLDAFRDNPELEPKHGEAGKAEKPVRCEWRTVVGADD